MDISIVGGFSLVKYVKTHFLYFDDCVFHQAVMSIVLWF